MISWLLFTFHLLVILYLSRRVQQRSEAELKSFFFPALAMKVISGWLLGLLYFKYYGFGDTISYFKDGVLLSSEAWTQPLGYLRMLLGIDPISGEYVFLEDPRALFFTRLVSFVNLFCLDNYWTVSMYLSWLSFLAAWHLVRTMMQEYPARILAVVISLLFLPSVVFWSSGIIKESISLASLYLLAAIVLKLWKGRRLPIWNIVLGVPALIILWKLKYYYVAAFGPVALTLLLYRLVMFSKLRFTPRAAQLVVFAMLFILPLLFVTRLHPNFRPHRLFQVIVENYETYQRMSAPGDAVVFAGLQPTIGSMLTHAPAAVVAGLFRPFLVEAGNFLQALAAFENLLMLVLTASAFIRFRKWFKEFDALAFATIVYVIILAVLITLSTPNLGTLVRYRVGFLPFFVLLILWENHLLQIVVHQLQKRFGRSPKAQ